MNSELRFKLGRAMRNTNHRLNENEMFVATLRRHRHVRRAKDRVGMIRNVPSIVVQSVSINGRFKRFRILMKELTFSHFIFVSKKV